MVEAVPSIAARDVTLETGAERAEPMLMRMTGNAVLVLPGEVSGGKEADAINYFICSAWTFPTFPSTVAATTFVVFTGVCAMYTAELRQDGGLHVSCVPDCCLGCAARKIHYFNFVFSLP